MNDPLYPLLIPVVTWTVVWIVRHAISKTPDAIVPILAAVVGAGADMIRDVIQNSDTMSVAVAALLGAAATGLDQAYRQWQKLRTAKRRNRATPSLATKMGWVIALCLLASPNPSTAADLTEKQQKELAQLFDTEWPLASAVLLDERTVWFQRSCSGAAAEFDREFPELGLSLRIDQLGKGIFERELPRMIVRERRNPREGYLQSGTYGGRALLIALRRMSDEFSQWEKGLILASGRSAADEAAHFAKLTQSSIGALSLAAELAPLLETADPRERRIALLFLLEQVR